MVRVARSLSRDLLKPALLALLMCLPGLAEARCAGQDMIANLPAPERNALLKQAASAPFGEGLIWRATREGAEVVLVGTYHLDDPRHDRLLRKITPYMEEAKLLLVEAGPQEEARLQAELTQNPDLMFSATGPSLPDMLSADDWVLAQAAFNERGIPAVFAAKMKPWYASVTLSMIPCAMREMAEGKVGLDKRLIAEAEARNLPIRALEPYDTAFHLFDSLTKEDERDLVIGALAVQDQQDDIARTLADAYFTGRTRLIWTFSEWLAYQDDSLPKEATARQMALTEKLMTEDRNRNWIPVVEAAASEGPVLFAAGALHLPGETGVLQLLAARGWAIERLD